MTRRARANGRWARRTGAIIAGAFTVAMLVSGLQPAAPAQALLDLDLPTWEDVQQAKDDESKTAAKVTEIENLIVQVEAEVERTRQESAAAAERLFEAEEDLQQAQERVTAFEEQAKKSAEEAAEASEQAAALVSQMYRSGGVDRSLEMFLEPDQSTADELLERLAVMEKATERNTTISDTAEQAMNSATSLGKQAEEARTERDRLREVAEAERVAAAEAADAAFEELEAQEEQEKVLTEQLAALKDTTADTVDGYQERLRLEEEERQRLAREAERRRQEELRRQQEQQEQNPGGGGSPPGGGGGGGGGGGSSPPPSSGGWTRPLSGGYWVSCEYLCYPGHYGIDLAAGSGTPIYATRGGSVSYSGYAGDWDYGWAVYIEHGGGLQSRYAHMVQAPSVRYGQNVSAGQLIGYVGSTGNSTGPHLHFEIRSYGAGQNPRAYMGF